MRHSNLNLTLVWDLVIPHLHTPMPALANIEHIWSTITEVDVQAIREQAHSPFRMALLGAEADALHWLHDSLRTDPFENVLYPLPETLWVYHLPGDQDLYESMVEFDLVLMVVPEGDAGTAEQQALSDLRRANPQLPALLVQVSSLPKTSGAGSVSGYQRSPSVVCVSPADTDPFTSELTPRLLTLFPEQHVMLAHHLPGLRRGITQRLIRETSIANAGYSASTGIAELVPVLLIPLNVADVVILSKNQAIMSYKLALALGKDIRVQDMAVELAGVLGTGFLWREVAHFLVGLAPGIGLVPKIAVAYAGTYVIGQAVYYWYGHQRKLTPEQIKEMFGEAMAEGRTRAAALAPKRRPKLRLPAVSRPALPRPSLRRRKPTCPNCQVTIGRNAYFCSNCGFSLFEIEDVVQEQPENSSS